ncbi:uncharacterized protein LOC126575624 [Anopheles aquasalis]|uniref:uncharacterized protein LOC126575624 n=1 Tax=Anopheles aquasalis TaxID=42839 RepID=UPI00215B203A|nr:uncharacterized protein LOC126575624 [Anopheles aquasalis]
MDVVKDVELAAMGIVHRRPRQRTIADYRGPHHLVLMGHGGPQAENLHRILHETAIKWIGYCEHVVFITLKPLEPVSNRIRSQYMELLNKIIVYCPLTFEEALDKLMGLQSWLNPLPDLVIVESLDLLLTAGTESVPSDPVGHADWIALRQSLFLACLSDTVRVLGAKLKDDCYSIVSFSDRTNCYDSKALAMFAREDSIIDTDNIHGPYDIVSFLWKLWQIIKANESEEENTLN